jgi:HSP20 family protein
VASHFTVLLLLAPGGINIATIRLKKKEVIMTSLVKTNRTVSPWRDFLDIDKFFSGGMERNFPAVNISENDKNYSVEVVAPGFKKEDFRIRVEDDMLTISAETKMEKANGNDKEYTRREYSYSSFTRSFHLPENVKDDKISASYLDGILKLELPKSKEQVKATKEIPIN